MLAVAPGTTLTPVVAAALSDEQVAALVDAHPLGRLGEPDDLGRLVVALASDLGRSVTGQVVFGDNGAQLRPQPPLALTPRILLLTESVGESVEGRAESVGESVEARANRWANRWRARRIGRRIDPRGWRWYPPCAPGPSDRPRPTARAARRAAPGPRFGPAPALRLSLGCCP